MSRGLDRKQEELLMQSEASPFIKVLLTLTLGHLYCQKKSVYLFLPSFSTAIKGYGSQLFMCLLRAREELIGLIYTSSRRLQATVQKNFLTLNFLENKVCPPHSQIFFFFKPCGINFLHKFIVCSLINIHLLSTSL